MKISKRDEAFDKLVEADDAKNAKRAKRIERITLGLSSFASQTIVKVIVLIISAYYVCYWAVVAIYAPFKYFMELW